MDELPERPSVSLPRARERAVETLKRLYSEDDIRVEELEARLDRCYRAATLAELASVFSDLPAAPDLSTPVAAPGPAGPARTAADDRRSHGLAVAILGGMGRSGDWTPPRYLHAVAVMGGAELDFRDARFPQGVTTVNALAVMGGVEVIVPSGLRVESAGLPLLGGFDRVDQEGDGTTYPGAVLRVRGLACMGGVDVKVRLPRSSG